MFSSDFIDFSLLRSKSQSEIEHLRNVETKKVHRNCLFFTFMGAHSMKQKCIVFFSITKNLEISKSFGKNLS